MNTKCESCKKDINKYKRDLSRNKYNYCSRECYNNRRKKNLKRLKRDTKYYNNLLTTSECNCGEDKLYLLQIHHIDGNNKNNIPENLEIVCGNCHIKRHLKRRIKDNTWIYHPLSLTPRELLKDL